MALPAFRSASAKAAGTGAVTVDLPAGMSANDVVILVATTIAGGSVSITANGSIGTWTAITGSPVDVTGGEKVYAWWGRWSSGATGPTVTPGSDHVCAGTVAYSNVITDASVINEANTGSETTSDSSFSFATGVSTTADNCLCVCVCTSGADSNTGQVPVMANASLASLASRLNINTNAGGGGGFGLSEGALATAGSMGTWSCTLAGNSPKSYITFALRSSTSNQTQPGKARMQTSGGLVCALWDSPIRQSMTAINDFDVFSPSAILAQAIHNTSGSDVSVCKVRLALRNDNAASRTVTVSFWTGANKSGSQIGTDSVPIAVAQGGDYTWFDATWASAPTIPANTDVFLTLTSDSVVADMRWANSNANPYEGTGYCYHRATDEFTAYDGTFEIYVLQSNVPLQTIPGKARIRKTVAQTTSGKARVQGTVAQTTTGKANIAASSSTQTQPGRARIQATASQTTTGKARVTAASIQVQAGASRIQNTSTQSQAGRARIRVIVGEDTSGIARIQVTSTAGISGRASIESAGGDTTTAQTISGRARISSPPSAGGGGGFLGFGFGIDPRRAIKERQQSQDGRARIGKQSSPGTEGRARIGKRSGKNSIGRGRIQRPASRLISGRARLSPKPPSIRTTSGAARIIRSPKPKLPKPIVELQKRSNRTTSGLARIIHNPPDEEVALLLSIV